MIFTRQAIETEKVRWEIDCLQENYLITVDDIYINTIGEPRHLDPNDAHEIFTSKGQCSLSAYLYVDKFGLRKLLSGKDEYFKLERVVVTLDDEIKLYFNKNYVILYSLDVNKDVYPSFVVSLCHKSGDALNMTKITVGEDRRVDVEKIF